MNNLVIPPSPNWYESKILACTADNTIIYGSRSDIVVIKPRPYKESANVKVILHAHYERITSIDANLSWGLDNMWAVSAGEDKIVKLWNIQDYSCKYSNNVHTTNSDKLIGAVFAGNDKIVAASENGFISIWRTITDEVTHLKNVFAFKVQITAISVCPHSSWLVAFGLKCGLVIITDLRKTGKVLYKMRGHDKSIISLSWCPVPLNIFPTNPKKRIAARGQLTCSIKNEERDENNGEINNEELINSSSVDSNVDISHGTSENEHKITSEKVNMFGDNQNACETETEKSFNENQTRLENQRNCENAFETKLDENIILQPNSKIIHIVNDTVLKVVDSCDGNVEVRLPAANEFERKEETSEDVPPEQKIDAKSGNSIAMQSNLEIQDFTINNSIQKNFDKNQDCENIASCVIDLQSDNEIIFKAELEVKDTRDNNEEDRKNLTDRSDINIEESKKQLVFNSELNNEIEEATQPIKEYLLASSCRGGSIYIWRAGTDGRKQVELYLSKNRNKRNYRNNEKTWISLCWITPDILLSSSPIGELLQWDLLHLNGETNMPQKKLVHHDHGNTLLAIAAPIQLLSKWEKDNWRNRKELYAWTVGQERFLLCTSLQADRTTLVSYPTNGGYIYCLTCSPLDPSRVAVGIGDNTAKIWDLSRPHVQCIIMTNLWQKIQSKVLTLAWHPTKESILAYGTLEGRIGLINSNNTSKLPVLLTQYFRTAVYKVTWGPLNGNLDTIGLYVCGEGQLAIYNVDTPMEEPNIMKIGNNEHVTCISWKSDYSLFAVGTKISSISIYNLNLEHITTIYSQHKTIHCILWHPEATAEDNEVSPYNSWLAISTGDASVIVYDLSKEKENGNGDDDRDDRIISVLNGHSKPVRCLCWSSYEGAKLVSGGDDGVAQVWDVKTKTIISTFTGHNVEAILAVLWSPLDKNFVITGGKDNCLRIWNINENKPINETDLAQMWKERSKLKQNLRRHKQAEESDDDAENVKVKRNVMLNLTAKAQNNMDTVLEDCKRIFSLSNDKIHHCLAEMGDNETLCSNTFDIIKLFGDKNNVIQLLELEQEKHLDKKKYICNQHISLWKGDIAETIKDAIKNGNVNPWLISIAPMVSPKLWQEACEVYAMKLIENTKSDPIEVVSYLLACHKVKEAIDVLCNATLYREALVLAKCRLSKTDPIINDILLKWASFSILNGTYEIAAQCFIILEQYEEAAKALFKRNDVKTLEFAMKLAEVSGNKDLKDAVMIRYKIFMDHITNLNGSKDSLNELQQLAVSNNSDRSVKTIDKTDSEIYVFENTTLNKVETTSEDNEDTSDK